MVSRKKRSLRLALKVAVLSLLGLILPSSCTPYATCYTQAAPYDTATPYATYDTTLPSKTPATTPFSPISPLPTPTPTEESRGALREKLLADSRFPERIARRLHE